MDTEPRPNQDRLSRDGRGSSQRIAILVIVGVLVIGAGGWFAFRAMTAAPAIEQRAIAAQEHHSQETPDAAAEPAEPDPATGTAGAAPAPAAAGAPDPRGEIFTERFEQADISKRWFISDGWSNGSWMANDWRASEVEKAPHGLTIHLRKSAAGSEYELAGGEIRTHDFYRYGYFEVRMKIPRDPGLVIGMFTYANRNGSVRPNEIDIEILGRSPRVAELTIHENGRATSKNVTLPFDASEGFHNYGFDWQPGHVRWYVDGELIHQETGTAARRLVRPQQLLISLWASRELKEWVGNLDTSRAPWQLDIACVAHVPAYSGPICS